MINSLMQIESRPQTRLDWQRQLWQARKTSWTELNTKLNTLQTAANSLSSATLWSGINGVTSTDSAIVTGTMSGTGAVSGTHTINVQQLAVTEAWGATSALAAQTAGTRESGIWYEGVGTPATGSTLLTNLTDFDGTPLGLAAGSKISLSASKNGSPVSATYTLTGTETMDDFMTWAQARFSGSSFSIQPAGTATYQSGTGVPNEITALTFTAVDALNAPLAVFNGTAGASSVQTVAAGGGVAANDTLTITQGANIWNVAIGRGENEAQIAARINTTSGIGVTASVVGGMLQLTSNSAGSSNAFSVSSAGSLAGDLGIIQSTAGLDAMFDVDGVSYSQTKNTGITGVITGVSLDLLATTVAAETLTVNSGTGSVGTVKDTIMSFVEKYNAVIDYINTKTGEDRIAKPKTLSEYLSAPMAHNSTMSTIGYQLRRWTTDVIGGLPGGAQMLADIGITTGAVSGSYSAASTTGKLEVDETALEAAITADSSAVQKIFAEYGDATLPNEGVARRISGLVSQWRTGGAVDSALDGASAQVTSLQQSIDRYQFRLDKRRAHYERMFAAMESTLGRMQQQGSWLSAQTSQMSQ